LKESNIPLPKSVEYGRNFVLIYESYFFELLPLPASGADMLINFTKYFTSTVCVPLVSSYHEFKNVSFYTRLLWTDN